jgi:hypothetical protein
MKTMMRSIKSAQRCDRPAAVAASQRRAGNAARVPRRCAFAPRASIEPYPPPQQQQQQQQLLQQRAARASVLPLVSSVVASSAQVATFESFAGRSAMVRLFFFRFWLKSAPARTP